MYISTHTVAHHLRQAFRKLNIASRVELTRIVIEQAAGDSLVLAAPSPSRLSAGLDAAVCDGGACPRRLATLTMRAPRRAAILNLPREPGHEQPRFAWLSPPAPPFRPARRAECRRAST
jgi:hypothetical protein